MADGADGAQTPPGGAVPWYLRSGGAPQDGSRPPAPPSAPPPSAPPLPPPAAFSAAPPVPADVTGPMPPVALPPAPAWQAPAPVPAAPPPPAPAAVSTALQAPAPASATRPPVPRPLVIGVAAALVVVLGGGGVTWALKGSDDDGGTLAAPDTSSAPSTTRPSTRPPVATTTVPTTTTPVTTTPTADPSVVAEQAALAQLQAMRAESVQRLVLDGRYVAQVASKSVGITDPRQTAQNGTHTFYATDILAESQEALQMVTSSEEVLLLQSTDFGRSNTTPDGQPYWVTLIDTGFSSSGDVKAWCATTFAYLDQQARDNACAVRTLTPPH